MINCNSGLFAQVMTHEFGHMLGLKHSPKMSSVMFLYYFGCIQNFKLSADDINRIQYLYGYYYIHNL